jgi:hypothetical protein
MPPARKSTRSSSRRSSAFKEPAAVKQLTRSLETAQKALTELGKQGSRDAGAATRSLQQDLRKFLRDAKRDTGKLTTALRRDFDQAQKTLRAQSSQSGRRATSGRRSAASGRSSGGRSGASRGTRKSS